MRLTDRSLNRECDYGMKVGGKHFRTIWLKPSHPHVVQIIDQRFLPHQFLIEEILTVAQMATAIREMHVRGAGLIGAAAAYGMYLASLESLSRHNIIISGARRLAGPTYKNQT